MAEMLTEGISARAPEGRALDAAYVLARLDEAGETLMALPSGGYTTRLRTAKLDFVAPVREGYAPEGGRLRPPVPPSIRITRMDETFGWLALIPQDRYVLRRIVGARALVSPVTGRHLYSWRRLGSLVGADHKAVQRWHAQGVDLLVAALNAGRG
jgi:hypothetical protein